MVFDSASVTSLGEKVVPVGHWGSSAERTQVEKDGGPWQHFIQKHSGFLKAPTKEFYGLEARDEACFVRMLTF